MISTFLEWIWKLNRNAAQTHGLAAGQLQVGFVVIPITPKGEGALFTPAEHEKHTAPPSALRSLAWRCSHRARAACHATMTAAGGGGGDDGAARASLLACTASRARATAAEAVAAAVAAAEVVTMRVRVVCVPVVCIYACAETADGERLHV